MNIRKILNYKLFKKRKENIKFFRKSEQSFNIKGLKEDIRDIMLDITDLGYNYNLNFYNNSTVTILIGYAIDVEDNEHGSWSLLKEINYSAIKDTILHLQNYLAEKNIKFNLVHLGLRTKKNTSLPTTFDLYGGPMGGSYGSGPYDSDARISWETNYYLNHIESIENKHKSEYLCLIEFNFKKED